MSLPMSRDLIITQNISLDGVIDAAEGWFGDFQNADLADVTEAQQVHMAAADAAVFGRVTYQQMESSWPKVADDRTGVTDYLNTVRKYVVTRTLTETTWQNSTILSGDPVEEITALKAQDGKDIVVTGSLQLVPTLRDAGIVDEYRLFVYPVAIGKGQRLFEGKRLGLELAEARPFRSGVVLMRYRTSAQK